MQHVYIRELLACARQIRTRTDGACRTSRNVAWEVASDANFIAHKAWRVDPPANVHEHYDMSNLNAALGVASRAPGRSGA
jgi:hypothetical protein